MGDRGGGCVGGAGFVGGMVDRRLLKEVIFSKSFVHVATIRFFLFDFSFEKAATFGLVDDFDVGASGNGGVGPVGRGAVVVASSRQVNIC